jgi:hypothetical protein
MSITTLLAAIVSFAGFQHKPAITGDYLEIRTASVFAGACHYNGEVVTTGHEALVAMKITAGSWNGVDLSGTIAAFEVASPDNLGNESAARKTEIVVNSSASDGQAGALADLLKAKYGRTLGNIVAVRRAAISFSHDGPSYTFDAKGFGSASVDAMPNDECCKQPNLVWYSPLITLEHRKVGYTKAAAYIAGSNGDAWEREGENSAFYGAFQL